MSDPKRKGEQCLKKSNILIFQQPSGKRTERDRGKCEKKMPIPVCMPKPKPIHICTGAELRKMCAPKACARPQPSALKTLSPLKLCGFALKCAVAAGLIYVTYDAGVWGGADDAQRVYSDACAALGRPIPRRNDKWDPPSCDAERELFPSRARPGPFDYCDEPPIKNEEAYAKFKSLWNCAVICVFRGIANFPSNVMPKKTEENASKQQ